MTKLRFLHITDLHINDPVSINEKLRAGFYKQYIKELVEKINEVTNSEKINFIISTGDYVNKAGAKDGSPIDEKFNHSQKVLDFISSELGIGKDKFAACIGNHDFEIETENKEIYKKYIGNQFTFGNLVKESDYYKIYHQQKEDLYLLEFDSTYHCNGKNVPGKLNDGEIDCLRSDILNSIKDDKLLLVISHYPMIIFDKSGLFSEEDNWVTNHLWRSGYKIVEAITKLRKKAITLWFFGDSHIPDFREINKLQYFFMTGMLGGDYVNRSFRTGEGDRTESYNKTDEVKLIEIEEDNSIMTYTFSYKPHGSSYDPQSGDWEYVKSSIRPAENPFELEKGTSISEDIILEEENITIEVISGSVEKQIIEEISNKNLYQFNRYITSNEESSLGWVQIHKMFENKELLCRCFDKAIDWIDERISSGYNDSSTIFIGIDFWGSMFASYASARRNIKNFCFATKHDGKHNNNFESVDYVCNQIKTLTELKHIIIFTDVVGTGNTVLKAKAKIETIVGNKNLIWAFVSIIADKYQPHRVDLSEFLLRGTLCSKLKIPILKNTDLPDFNILPAKYDLR